MKVPFDLFLLLFTMVVGVVMSVDKSVSSLIGNLGVLSGSLRETNLGSGSLGSRIIFGSESSEMELDSSSSVYSDR